MALELAPRSVLDVGTGSGALALAVASELPGTEVVATDVSDGALALATENADRLSLANRVRFERGTLPDRGQFDLALANLPYVREGEWMTLAPEITRFEPREALVAGADGLDAIRGTLDALGAEPTRVAAIALEVGDGQATEVRRLASQAGFDDVRTRRDLAGIERVLVGRRA